MGIAPLPEKVTPHPSDRAWACFHQPKFRLRPAHTLSLRPHKNPTWKMSDSSHTSPSSTETFEPRATLRYTSAVGIQAAGVGALVSAVQNALSSHNHGAFGIFTRTGGTIGFFGAFLPRFNSTHGFELNWNHPIGRLLWTTLNLW